MTKLLGHPDD